MYLQDPHNQNRIVTVAYEWNESSVTYGVTVNNPDTGDIFQKSLGRKIAEGRLRNNRTNVKVARSGERPIETIVYSLTNNETIQPVRRIAINHLVNLTKT